LEGGAATVEKLGAMTPEQLLEIPGIEPEMVEQIQQAVVSYYGQFESEGEQPESAETAILAEPEAEPPSETGAAGAESSGELTEEIQDQSVTMETEKS
jgi:N utilization substance protein A